LLVRISLRKAVAALIFTVKYISEKARKDSKKVNSCQFLRLRKANGQKKESEQNREDGEKSARMRISLEEESILPLNML